MLRAAALIALLALPAAAQSIDSINGIPVPFADPENDIIVASIGTELTITGSGFAGLTGLSKPKVFTDSLALPKNRALKIVSATDTELVVAIKSGVPGDFDLTVQPKGAGLLPLVAEGAVRLVPPQFEEPAPAAPGELVTLAGLHGDQTFGAKLGKVKVDGKKVPVTSWTPAEVSFVVPATLANGIYTVELTNKLAKATVEPAAPNAPWSLVVEGSDVDVGGPDRFSCKVGSKKYAVDPGLFQLIAGFETTPTPHVTISAVLVPGLPGITMSLLVPVDLETATFPLVLQGGADGAVDITEAESFLDLHTWSTDFEGEGSGDWLFVLHGYEPNEETEGTQLAGEFSAVLHTTGGDGIPAKYTVKLGDFRVTVDPEVP